MAATLVSFLLCASLLQILTVDVALTATASPKVQSANNLQPPSKESNTTADATTALPGNLETTETPTKIRLTETSKATNETAANSTPVPTPSPDPAQKETTVFQKTNLPQTTSSAREGVSKTTKAPENCMKARAKDFKKCMESLGNNAIQYIASQNLTGFLDDICDDDRSKPIVECIKGHFKECPDFLDRPEVDALEFGPYHIKDINHFDTIDQMCRCSDGLVCINKLLETKQTTNLTITDPGAPWMKMPNFAAICEHDTARYIGCVRQNLRQCQTALNRRYGDEFTYNDAEDLKGMYDFIKDHCDEVNDDDFVEKYRCIYEASRSSDMHACVRRTDSLKVEEKTCKIRDCVSSVLDPDCDDDMVSLYIDAVNIYTHDSTKLLNFPCSGATDIGLSIATVILTFVFVLYY